MTTPIHLPQEIGEERFVLAHISWETYESLLADYADSSSPRFTYSEGTLEIVSPTIKRERMNRILASIADTVAEEMEIVPVPWFYHLSPA